MCKGNYPDKKQQQKNSMGCVRETPHIKIKEASLGCVRETPHRYVKLAWDV